MSGRDDRLYEEAAALWRSLYGDAPPRGVDGARILDLIVNGLPEADYGRLASPHLRPGAVVFPKR
ncbi:MAG: hypothetical protein GC203_08390 [Phenylobacterium sp.]|uniref:hypothetical protein n=1 Tax=Phenylobacterium sp. TaxID=1871053 RepID=UPI0025FF15B7|nr:hypothetical protein [Phenylobacterium sp.]MBI1197868.1 hypothetical protein [Phenylobacterium sp.]